MLTYTLKSIKRTGTVTGTLQDAIDAAVAHEAEYQPPYGVDISAAGKDLCSVLDGAISANYSRALALRAEAGQAGDDAMVALVDRLGEGDAAAERAVVDALVGGEFFEFDNPASQALAQIEAVKAEGES